jgi:ERCC4-type nuclease
MLILADSNEQATAPKVVQSLRDFFGEKNVVVAHLKFGDYNIPLANGNLLSIERKAVGDFLGSISDNRLFEQAERMMTNTPFSIFVMTGNLAYNSDDYAVVDGQVTNWRGASIRAAMLCLQMTGCAIVPSSYAYFPNVMGEIADTLGKPIQHFHLRKVRAITFPPIDKRVELLAQFPGIGLKRAAAMLAWVSTKQGEFGRLCDALDWATKVQLLKEENRPEGWGTITIQNMRTILGLKPNEFLSIQQEEQDEETDGESAESGDNTDTTTEEGENA